MPVNLETPYTYENSSNPWIMDPKSKEGWDSLIKIDGQSISAEYMWSLNAEGREKLLKKVFAYYREKGFPYEVLNEKDLINEFKKLKSYDSKKILTPEGFISNSGNLCLDVCRHFNKDNFWKAKGDTRSISIEEVFGNDELFIKILKNRMGWNTSKEDGTERPYMFGISDKAIRDGIKNSGLGYGVSNFRPTIAKFFYEKYLKGIKEPKVFDYSAGWGARALAAMSLGIKYYATDPLTHEAVNKMLTFYNGEGRCYNLGSENEEICDLVPKVDMCLSCPPYFTLERYSEDKTQSYNQFDEYKDWIEKYWRGTVQNCYKILKEGGKFVLIIKDSYKKFEIKKNMEQILFENGFISEEMFQYKTSKNHLSGKIKTGELIKNSEYVLVYTKEKE